jgi:hypothetical protein
MGTAVEFEGAGVEPHCSVALIFPRWSQKSVMRRGNAVDSIANPILNTINTLSTQGIIAKVRRAGVTVRCFATAETEVLLAFGARPHRTFYRPTSK